MSSVMSNKRSTIYCNALSMRLCVCVCVCSYVGVVVAVAVCARACV